MVICRDTEAEAWAYCDAIIAHADAASPLGFQTFDSDAHAWRGRKGRDQPWHRALGGKIQIIGSPEQVVHYVLRLHAAGIDGIQFSFYDLQPGLEFFGARVVPLLQQADLRR